MNMQLLLDALEQNTTHKKLSLECYVTSQVQRNQCYQLVTCPHLAPQGLNQISLRQLLNKNLWCLALTKL